MEFSVCIEIDESMAFGFCVLNGKWSDLVGPFFFLEGVGNNFEAMDALGLVS